MHMLIPSRLDLAHKNGWIIETRAQLTGMQFPRRIQLHRCTTPADHRNGPRPKITIGQRRNIAHHFGPARFMWKIGGQIRRLSRSMSVGEAYCASNFLSVCAGEYQRQRQDAFEACAGTLALVEADARRGSCTDAAQVDASSHGRFNHSGCKGPNINRPPVSKRISDRP